MASRHNLLNFRSFEGQDMQAIEKLDLRVNNTVVRDQFLWPAIAVSIREQVYELAVQNVASAKEYRMGKKGRQGPESVTSSKFGNGSIDVLKLFGSKGSVIRKRKEWHLYEQTVDILSTEEVEALDAREERNARTKKKLDDNEDSFQTH